MIGDFVAGWAFARQLGWVIPAASCALVFNALVSGAINVLGPVIADDTIGSEGWGLAGPPRRSASSSPRSSSPR